MIKSLGRIFASCTLVVLSGMASADMAIETVRVGDVGNTADTTGYGRVDYAYSIGKYEVTAGQYTVFLNAVASRDTYGLYVANMASPTLGGGITRLGTDGSYTYTVKADFVNRPVNYVSFWQAARFANWLHNGQPTGQQKSNTTEDGAYTLTSGGISANTITRNARALWALPSENEWYKAAYYKAGGTDAGYWLYPTRSNTTPGRDMADASGNNVNYLPLNATPFPIDSGRFTTVAGEFQNSVSGYNTFDQGGNVAEWNETIVDPSWRRVRGGAFSNPYGVQSVEPSAGFPPDSISQFGFRVVQVPMPTSLAMAGLGLASLLTRRRRVAG